MSNPITQVELDYLALQGFTTYINDVVAVAGTQYRNYDTCKVTIESGVIVSATTGRDEDGYNLPTPTIASDGRSAIINGWATMDLSTAITWTIEPNGETIVKGVNDVYLINPDFVRGIITDNFNRFDGNENTDFGKFILGLIELPFTINIDDIVKTQKVKLGELTTEYDGELLKSDVLKVDLGSIGITSNKGNFLDYKNKTIVLHLPYSEPVALEIEYVINEIISIEYLINLYDGVAIINISSSKIGGVIATRNVDLNVSIPFGDVTTRPQRNDPSNVELGGDNGVKTAYIEILENKAILENGFFTIPILDEDLLTNQSGYVEVENVQLITSATSREKENIISQLRNGVIF